jgi:hypothetical protein
MNPMSLHFILAPSGTLVAFIMLDNVVDPAGNVLAHHGSSEIWWLIVGNLWLSLEYGDSLRGWKGVKRESCLVFFYIYIDKSLFLSIFIFYTL